MYGLRFSNSGWNNTVCGHRITCSRCLPNQSPKMSDGMREVVLSCRNLGIFQPGKHHAFYTGDCVCLSDHTLPDWNAQLCALHDQPLKLVSIAIALQFEVLLLMGLEMLAGPAIYVSSSTFSETLNRWQSGSVCAFQDHLDRFCLHCWFHVMLLFSARHLSLVHFGAMFEPVGGKPPQRFAFFWWCFGCVFFSFFAGGRGGVIMFCRL